MYVKIAVNLVDIFEYLDIHPSTGVIFFLYSAELLMKFLFMLTKT